MQPQANLQLDRVFQALSDSTRRSILRNLVKGERSVSDIAKPFDLTFAAVSKHLKVLEAADLIDRRKQGSFQMIRLNPKNLKTAGQWLRFYEQFWSVRMDALKTLLEEKE
jgi:DNA-binding transcriptional ArsR family regulator